VAAASRIRTCSDLAGASSREEDPPESAEEAAVIVSEAEDSRPQSSSVVGSNGKRRSLSQRKSARDWPVPPPNFVPTRIDFV
jgi:hypothetical protein